MAATPKCPLCDTPRSMRMRGRERDLIKWFCSACASEWLLEVEDERKSGGEYDTEKPEGAEYEDGDGGSETDGDGNEQGEGESESESEGEEKDSKESPKGEGGHGEGEDQEEDNLCDLLAQALTGTGMVPVTAQTVGASLRVWLADAYCDHNTCSPCEPCKAARLLHLNKGQAYIYVEPKQPASAGEILALLEKYDAYLRSAGKVAERFVTSTPSAWVSGARATLLRFAGNADYTRTMDADGPGVLS